ncbi:peptide-methionine (S)-S-oxide reductase [Algoriphagus ratkowskyi]|uniref:Peptide methionine sulfoxide reductase MsrA n=1 Tax=Algoriphagus ratkowskyi TaxID=57028 RepID=A0A2W7RCJ6_9BACT|nr:peptide-methionine (S)-S-oxide reductase MsrA [Algoriphagus ratkowskyi]PZX56846.1 peptide-methionine (S)-S-oxide reductase [Algoriphagus ratkowskyi]TXD79761.1 peptide-methionine (S)-S-oxide reductase MsrA [Algoriphagus ratkowskyi]
MDNQLKLPTTEMPVPDGLNRITLGAGCFWCIEAVFQRIQGVQKIVSGYSGGFVEDPSYSAISSGTTGHAEVIQIYYNPVIISLTELLEIFWATHDPTSLNKQGGDAGPQYRSSIFYDSLDQKKLATSLKKQLDDSQVFDSPIVTEISTFSNFYAAEDKHQDYYNQHAGQPYCQFVIKPKVDKLKKFFAERLK